MSSVCALETVLEEVAQIGHAHRGDGFEADVGLGRMDGVAAGGADSQDTDGIGVDVRSG